MQSTSRSAPKFVAPRLVARHQTLRRPQLAVLLLAVVVAGPACAPSSKFVAVRPVPTNALSERLPFSPKGVPQPTERTMLLLRRYGLAEEFNPRPHATLDRLSELIDEDPSTEKLYAFAELAYITAKRTERMDEQVALDLYGASVAHAYLYLFDPRVGFQRNPYDPQFRGACDLYNGALEEAMRLVGHREGLQPGSTHTIDVAGQTWQISVVSRGMTWRESDFDRFEFVSDYELRGLTNRYRTHGLGVPLIAIRGDQGESPVEKFYPSGLAFPVTAFLRVLPPQEGAAVQGMPRQVLLELYDPLTSTDTQVADARVPLESDLSTPLAYFLENPELSQASTRGLLSPEKTAPMRGLYMVQPYQPGKIPVLLVHGLWSSPITWMEMFNDLRSAPEIRDHFQFWFYLYPTGQPFWISAKQLRDDLAQARAVLDPQRQEPTLDQMVLIGHSMGGLVSKMQTIDSGNEYWNIVSDKPFHLVKAEPEMLSELERTFFFSPNRSIRRVVTIGTPHRGSPFSNQATRYLASKLIELPKSLVDGSGRIYRDNPDVFRSDTHLLRVSTSIDSLAPDSPVLPVLLNAPHPPWVKYHNIVGVLDRDGIIGSLANGTDGVVTYESAHLTDVESELIVNADHLSVHRHPLSVLEVRRILFEHLREMQAERQPPPPAVYQAAGPGYPPHVTPEPNHHYLPPPAQPVP